MKTRYRLTRRGIREDTFYCVDKTTGKRTSLRTADADDDRQIIEARNSQGARAEEIMRHQRGRPKIVSGHGNTG